MNIEQTENQDPVGDNKKLIDFDQVLEGKIKLGKQQWLIFICGSLLWLSDGAEMLVVGFIAPIIQKEWDLTDFQINWLGSSLFTCWAIGAMAVGRIADKIGRKKPIIWGALGQFVCAIASAFSPNFVVLCIIRAMFGLCLGLTAPVISTLFSETFPKRNRGRYFVLMNSCFVFGELITVLVAYFCLDSLTSGNWRLLLVWSSFPALISLFVIITTLTESPRYLLICTEKYDKAFKVINKMIKRNHKDVYEAVKLQEFEKEGVMNWIQKVKEIKIEVPGYSNLFNSHYKWITIKTMLMWFSLSFVYYGVMYILPTTLFKLHGSDKYEDNVKDGDGKDGNSEDFAGIALTAAVEIPSCIAAAILIEVKKVGRKNSMALAYGLCSVCCFIVFFLHHADTAFFVFVSGCKVMINFCFQIIYPFTAEIYDTNIRSTGCGFNNSVCRIGGIMMPWISFVFFYISNTGPFLIFGVVTVISFLAALSIKEDTTGKALDQFIVNKSKEEGKDNKEENLENEEKRNSFRSSKTQDQNVQLKDAAVDPNDSLQFSDANELSHRNVQQEADEKKINEIQKGLINNEQVTIELQSIQTNQQKED